MRDIEKLIDHSINKQPDYSRLDNLSSDVWKRINQVRFPERTDIAIPFGIKVTALATVIIAITALSQISFINHFKMKDPLDLRYFSYQTVPAFDLAAINTYELEP